jgi:hypothetical protein
MLKQIANTIAADLDLVKFNLGELKRSIQLVSLILLTILSKLKRIRIQFKFKLYAYSNGECVKFISILA